MPSRYWEQRILADERRATEIAQRASDELAKMYRTQYLRKVGNPLGFRVRLCRTATAQKGGLLRRISPVR